MFLHNLQFDVLFSDESRSTLSLVFKCHLSVFKQIYMMQYKYKL